MNVTILDIGSKLQSLETGFVFAVEGFCGSGKTTIADDLSKSLGIEVCHFDNYARESKHPNSYLRCLDFDALRETFLKRDISRSIIIESICLRDVCAHLNLAPTYFAYLKRVGVNGLWYDGFHLQEYEEKQTLTNEPHRSDFEYHLRARPHEIADFVLTRVDQESS